MLQPLSSTVTAMASPKPKNPNPNPNPNPSCSISCKHSPSATLDLLILILVLFSCTFLITSSFSYIFRSLSYLLDPLNQTSIPSLVGFIVFLAASIVAIEISCHRAWLWSRRCDNPKCKGLKKAVELSVKLQTEECLKSSDSAAAWKEIDELPRKGGEKGNNPEFECLRSELRRMAPPNGRAVLLFRARCGCPVAKLEAWGSKRGRR